MGDRQDVGLASLNGATENHGGRPAEAGGPNYQTASQPNRNFRNQIENYLPFQNV